MEPMTLGSPVQSPVHLGQPPNFSNFQSPVPTGQPPLHSTMVGQGLNTPLGQSPALAGSQMQQSNPAFLPGYLMGQPQQPTNRVMSPTKLNRSMSNMSSNNTPTTIPQITAKPINGFLTPTTPVSAMRTPSEKTGGPPIKGLYVSSPRKKFGTPLNGGNNTPRGILNCTPLNTTPQLSFGAGTPGGGVTSTFDITDSGSIDGDTWVTVFGFPPSAACYILSQFSQCGTILQHHMPPNGNWMKIRFQTKMQAQKALGRSGRVFNGNLMIGVSVCLDPPQDAINASQLLDQTGTNLDASVVSLNSSLASHNRSIRPLTQSYKAAHNEHEVSAIANTPNKNAGIVSRAMEYVFGW